MARKNHSSNRILYVDKLRGLAVLAMFFVHSAGAWLSQQAKQTTYYGAAMKLSGFVAPTFLTLAGLSVVIIARRAGADEFAAASARRKVMRRGAEIWLLGYVLNFAYQALGGFRGDWMRLGRVDVLHCIGASLVVLAVFLWPRPDKPGRIAVAALLFLLFPIAGLMTTGSGAGALLLPGLREYAVTDAPLGLFPFVPYGAWIFFGVVLGAFWHSLALEKGREGRLFAGLALSAVVVWLASHAVAWGYYHLGVVELMETRPRRGLPHVFLEKSAFVLAAFCCAWGSERLLRKILPKASLLALWGQTSLFSYCAHLIVIYHVVGGALIGELGPGEQMAWAAVLAAVMAPLAAVWQRRGRAVAAVLGRFRRPADVDPHADVVVR